MSRDPPKNNDPGEDINFLISLPKVPNSPTYPWWQIPPHHRNDLEADPDWEFHRNSKLANFESWGIVFNSFASLESVYFDHLKREVGHNRVWAVGPVLPLEGDLIGSATRGGASSVPCHELMTWLDVRLDNSVVYVCFGSRDVLTSKQLKVLASALECSGVHFILYARVPDDQDSILDGFRDRVHRKHVEYLNKKSEMYNELAIVIGKDTAMGSFSKSYVDIENEPDNGDSTEFVTDNAEEGVVDKGKNVVESSATGSRISKSRKRGRAPPFKDSVLTDLSNQLKEIVVALKEINRGPIDYTTLYSNVMAMMADGYSEDMLATAFDHLCENKKAARGFLAKNAKLRKLWMDNFLCTHL
nr:udp-glycosyltransferase 89b1 [Quercus suber]